MGLKEKLHNIRRSVIFLGVWVDNDSGKKTPQYVGTGFLIAINNRAHIVTAKHVVHDLAKNFPESPAGYVFFNSLDGVLSSISVVEVIAKCDVNWMFHENPTVDLAVIPFVVPSNSECKYVDVQDFIDVKTLHELTDVFLLSYQPELEVENKIVPIFRNGTISMIKDQGPFYIDCTAFPGNGGSPVFTKWLTLPEDNRLNTQKFIGIVGNYIHVDRPVFREDVDEFNDLSVKENTGLTEIWPVSYLNDIVRYDAFLKQLSRI